MANATGSAVLCMHAGAASATLKQVARVATPAPTKTWRPVPHMEIIDLVKSTLKVQGYRVENESYGLWDTKELKGARMFGVMELRNGSNKDDYALCVGLRNSHDMSLSCSAALGSRVFVCDNMAFSGEVTFARKHTPGISNALPRLVDDGIGRLIGMKNFQDNRIATYKDLELDDHDARSLIIDGFKLGVIGERRIRKVLQEWESPTHEDFAGRNGWSLFNAFTEALKGNIIELPTRTQKLHRMFDVVAGIEVPVADVTEEMAEQMGREVEEN